MMKFTINSPRLAGFVAEEIKANEKGRVIVKCPLATSDSPQFHLWMRHITGLFFSKLPVPVDAIHRFLIVLHADNNADVYLNDFSELAQMRVTKDVVAGAPVFLNDISDVTEVKFPDIEIESDDAIIYGARTGWRFSLYYDFSREIDPSRLAEELGTLKREALFYIERADLDAKLSPRRLIEADAVVIAEGKSDVRHLVSAAQVLGVRHAIDFLDDDSGRGADTLYTMCQHYSLMPQPKPMLFVFDRDRDDIVKKLAAKEKEQKGFQDWGNNVYSLCLPAPQGRSDATHALCIEFFYSDADLCRPNRHGRRLFLSSEFHPKSGRHRTENVHTTRVNTKRANKINIIDTNVFDHTNTNIALSKNDFAEAVASDDSFKDVDRSSFRLVFDLFEKIIDEASRRRVLNDRHWRPDRRADPAGASPSLIPNPQSLVLRA